MGLNRILLRKFRNREIAIAVRTKSDWLFLMELLERENDIEWDDIGLSSISVEDWEECKEDSAIAFGRYGAYLGYADTKHYKDMGLKIIELDEILEERMSFAEKVEFIYERLQDGKEFFAGEEECVFINGDLYSASDSFPFPMDESKNIMKYNLSLIRRFELTEAERVILENVYEFYNYLVRNEMGDLFLHKTKPRKGEAMWLSKESWMHLPFGHLFPFITWENDQAFNFREYLEELEEES